MVQTYYFNIIFACKISCSLPSFRRAKIFPIYDSITVQGGIHTSTHWKIRKEKFHPPYVNADDLLINFISIIREKL